jgi:hypothetical protein
MAIAGRVLGRRQLLVHAAAGLGSIVAGSALGASLFWRQRGSSPSTPPDAAVARSDAAAAPRPDSARTAAARQPDAGRADSPAARPAVKPTPAVKRTTATRPASRPAPLRKGGKRRQRPDGGQPLRPVGPDPGGSDHDDDGARLKKKDDPYDLVD